MFCSNCGATAADSAVFCTKCGATLGQLPPEAASLPSESEAQMPMGSSNATIPVPSNAGIARGVPALRIILLVLLGLAAVTTGTLYFAAPGPSQTVRNFAQDVNNHAWDNVAGYASTDTCQYVEKQRDLALSAMKLVSSLTGLINGALPSILDNALGVMGVSTEKLQKMNGRELLAGLLKVTDLLKQKNGNGNQRINIAVVSEQVNGNRAVVHVRNNGSGEEADIQLVREGIYWKIDFVANPESPVFPLEYLLQNAGLGNKSANPGSISGPAPSSNDNNHNDKPALGDTRINQTDKAEMVWVPDGTFMMGSIDGVGRDNEHPSHQVTLSGYWIYKYQVKVSQYRAFCAATSHALPQLPSGYCWKGDSDWSAPELQQHPIVNVSWSDCTAYATWAGVSLPTEAQYEYAASGPHGNNYPWGGTATAADLYNGWDQTKCVNGYNSYAVGKSTWPVGSFPAGASWCGAQDMAGNVWEWCADWFGDYSTTPVINPTGPASGTQRVLRGGSWDSGSAGVYRGACRNINNPSNDFYNIGFRCVALSPGP